eukprot:gene4955-5438_t
MADLDAILDQALDDYEEQALKNQVNAVQNTSAESEEEMLRQAQAAQEERERMEALLASLQDPAYGDVLQSTLKSLSGTQEGIQTVDELFEELSKQFDNKKKPTSSLYPQDLNDTAGLSLGDREVAATMNMIGASQRGMEGFEPAKIEEAGETMMDEMITQFEALGEKEDYNEVIDGVMRQLLSKDLMYDPTKMICRKFPEWLAIQRKHLTVSEYENYGRQYQCFQKILAVYDTEPDNFPRLMELMFDLQQFGQPPAEIIKGLAPGLQFDENGMPIMPNMGAGMMPEMPGGQGLPNLAELSENMANGQCNIC